MMSSSKGFLTMHIAFVGMGHLAQSFLYALKNRSQVVTQVSIYTRSPKALAISDPCFVSTPSDLLTASVLFLAVKPSQIKDLKNNYSDYTGHVISAVAVISIDTLKKYFPKANSITRCMFHLGIEFKLTAVHYVTNTSPLPDCVRDLWRSVGELSQAQGEKDLDALTLLFGSMPALLSALLKPFLTSGLTEKELLLLAAASLPKIQQVGIEETIKQVSTPGGVTQAALMKAKDVELSKLLLSCLDASVRRTQDLSRDLNS
jgi:pyrroline-5-carboxylate reductase